MSLLDLKRIGDDILLYEPHVRLDGGHSDSQGASMSEPGRPSLIVLCTWLGGATDKRIERYTQHYHDIWPASSILLIRTTLTDFLARSEKSLHRKLRPAHREIRRIAIHPCSRSGKPTAVDGAILLHIFSQGGINMATHLVTSLNSILGFMGRDVPLHLRQIVLDSCPGVPDIHSSYAAGVHSLPRDHPLRPLGCAALYVMAVSIASLEATGLRKPLAKIMRKQLNDPDIFSPRAARLYLTSRADRIVETKHVKAHFQQATAKGLETEILVFDRAGHCSLVLEDESSYWNAIVSCWKRSGLHSKKDITRTGTAEEDHSGGDTFRVGSEGGRSRL